MYIIVNISHLKIAILFLSAKGQKQKIKLKFIYSELFCTKVLILILTLLFHFKHFFMKMQQNLLSYRF